MTLIMGLESKSVGLEPFEQEIPKVVLRNAKLKLQISIHYLTMK